MSRLRAAPFVFAALLIAGAGVCVAGPVRAQTNDLPPSPYSTGIAIRTEQFQKERRALTAEARQSVSTADANIGALQDKARSPGEPERTRYTNIADRLLVLKRHVMTDIDKMGNASVNDWDGLHPVVQGDLSALNAQLKHASTITHIPAPGQ